MNKYSYGNQVCKRFDALYNKREFSQFKRYDNLIWQFKKQFHSDCCFVASSSGRVEIIGNHTDHNGGVVLGCAVNADIIGAFLPNDGSVVRMCSDGYPLIKFDVDKVPQLVGGAGLAEGVTTYLKQAGYAVRGFDLYTHSNVPSGAGISSSASLEMLIAAIVNVCFNNGAIPNEVLAKAGQYAEHKYLNKPCGLLDQGAVLVGGTVRFDFKDGFANSKLQVDTSALRLVLVNTGKSHAGLSHLYAAIPAEMYSVAGFFGKQRLIEVDYSQLLSSEQAIRSTLGNRPYLRAKHFFEENARVERMSAALQNGDINKVIRLINESGYSSLTQLQNCAVDEHDTAIEEALLYARALGNVGARVHGGGFAGTILCVMPTEQFNSVYSALVERYGDGNVIPMSIRQVGTIIL